MQAHMHAAGIIVLVRGFAFLHLTVEAQKRNSIAEALPTPFVTTANQLCSTAASLIFFFSFFVTMLLGFGACQHAHTLDKR